MRPTRRLRRGRGGRGPVSSVHTQQEVRIGRLSCSHGYLLLLTPAVLYACNTRHAPRTWGPGPRVLRAYTARAAYRTAEVPGILFLLNHFAMSLLWHMHPMSAYWARSTQDGQRQNCVLQDSMTEVCLSHNTADHQERAGPFLMDVLNVSGASVPENDKYREVPLRLTFCQLSAETDYKTCGFVSRPS